MEINNRLLLKIIELGIAVACIVLYETKGDLSSNPMIVCGTLVGYTVICGVLLVGHILGSVVEKRLNALLSIIGCALFIISGALLIEQWHDASDLVIFKEKKRYALAAGSLMIINGVVFILDTLSICRT